MKAYLVSQRKKNLARMHNIQAKFKGAWKKHSKIEEVVSYLYKGVGVTVFFAYAFFIWGRLNVNPLMLELVESSDSKRITVRLRANTETKIYGLIFEGMKFDSVNISDNSSKFSSSWMCQTSNDAMTIITFKPLFTMPEPVKEVEIVAFSREPIRQEFTLHNTWIISEEKKVIWFPGYAEKNKVIGLPGYDGFRFALWALLVLIPSILYLLYIFKPITVIGPEPRRSDLAEGISMKITQVQANKPETLRMLTLDSRSASQAFPLGVLITWLTVARIHLAERVLSKVSNLDISGTYSTFLRIKGSRPPLGQHPNLGDAIRVARDNFNTKLAQIPEYLDEAKSTLHNDRALEDPEDNPAHYFARILIGDDSLWKNEDIETLIYFYELFEIPLFFINKGAIERSQIAFPTHRWYKDARNDFVVVGNEYFLGYPPHLPAGTSWPKTHAGEDSPDIRFFRLLTDRGLDAMFAYDVKQLWEFEQHRDK